ncbi:Dolichyl-diphosphooligosaccharide--protein glycosyltransferase subunit 3 [Nakaseomyces bracarensis]|uniref:Dolichyl-diphosphooligosaccharide--protein glycosyltransferase subunit 3 n=1 Tax=Nakaseomyces bracarensis TaxID=273131 RepID=A0ABR4NMQ2_9SACH
MKLSQLSWVIALFSVVIHTAHALSPKQFLKEKSKYSNEVIALNDRNWGRLLANPKKSYLVALFTATGAGYGCNACIDLEPKYENLVKSWYKDHPDGFSKANADKSMFFMKVDAIDANLPELFKTFRIEQVPTIIIFEPGTSKEPSYKILDAIQDVEEQTIIDNIKRETNIHDFVLHQDINWSSVVVTGLATFGTVLFLKKQRSLALKIFTNRYVWGFATTFFIVSMISGSMFNRIRATRHAGVDGNQDIVYFMPNIFSNQYAIESQIVGLVYIIQSVLVVSLVMLIPRIKSKLNGPEKAKETIQIAVGIGAALLVYMFFTAYTNMFSIKNPMYPFTLIKIFKIFK